MGLWLPLGDSTVCPASSGRALPCVHFPFPLAAAASGGVCAERQRGPEPSLSARDFGRLGAPVPCLEGGRASGSRVI